MIFSKKNFELKNVSQHNRRFCVAENDLAIGIAHAYIADAASKKFIRFNFCKFRFVTFCISADPRDNVRNLGGLFDNQGHRSIQPAVVIPFDLKFAFDASTVIVDCSQRAIDLVRDQARHRADDFGLLKLINALFAFTDFSSEFSLFS